MSHSFVVKVHSFQAYTNHLMVTALGGERNMGMRMGRLGGGKARKGVKHIRRGRCRAPIWKLYALLMNSPHFGNVPALVSER